mmetsp:Transcript_10762/g.24002  ORF Transcript_10762/g.24002 Transcript_10762/m.24002 type:complete len:161 (+) Transcript_10762:3644-4126(+)
MRSLGRCSKVWAASRSIPLIPSATNVVGQLAQRNVNLAIILAHFSYNAGAVAFGAVQCLGSGRSTCLGQCGQSPMTSQFCLGFNDSMSEQILLPNQNITARRMKASQWIGRNVVLRHSNVQTSETMEARWGVVLLASSQEIDQWGLFFATDATLSDACAT